MLLFLSMLWPYQDSIFLGIDSFPLNKQCANYTNK